MVCLAENQSLYYKWQIYKKLLLKIFVLMVENIEISI